MKKVIKIVPLNFISYKILHANCNSIFSTQCISLIKRFLAYFYYNNFILEHKIYTELYT